MKPVIVENFSNMVQVHSKNCVFLFVSAYPLILLSITQRTRRSLWNHGVSDDDQNPCTTESWKNLPESILFLCHGFSTAHMCVVERELLRLQQTLICLEIVV